MRITRREALGEYGSRIMEHGAGAGEAVIKKYEAVFADFRNLAYALRIILRADELLQEEEHEDVFGVRGDGTALPTDAERRVRDPVQE